MVPILQAAAAAIVALGTGATAVVILKQNVPDLAVREAPSQPGSVLDGRSFSPSPSRWRPCRLR